MRGSGKNPSARTSGSALLCTKQLAGAGEDGFAGYSESLALLYISLRHGWVEAKPQL